MAGDFIHAEGTLVNHVAKWDGSTWDALEDGTSGSAHALHTHDDGTGPALYAGGVFAYAGDTPVSGIAQWDGSTWSALGDGVNQPAYVLETYDDGNGPDLYVGGNFWTAGGVSAGRIAQWDGSTWWAVSHAVDNAILALTTHDDGNGEALYAGGVFSIAGGISAYGVAKWNDTFWSPLGDEFLNGEVYALAAYDDGTGEALYVAGYLPAIGALEVNHVAKWDGVSWSALGSGVADGSTTTAVYALAVYDDGSGPALYAGGNFTSAGGVSANRIAKWDGTSWSALGTGVTGVVNPFVYSLAVYDDGSGEALYVGGGFIFAGSVGGPGPAGLRLARWNGSTWSMLGTSGVSGPVRALVVHDDGGGAALYAGGAFTTVSGMSAARVAKWNGTAWSALGSGVDGVVRALASYDDGNGAALYAGGDFLTAGGAPADLFAKWDGGAWSAPGGEMIGGEIYTLATYDDGDGPALYMGGVFIVPSTGDMYLAKWGGCASSPLPSGWTDLGGALAGTGGITPLLTGTGSLSSGSSNALTLSQALPSSAAHFVLGLSPIFAPFKSGTLVPAPHFLISGLPVSGAGEIHLPFAGSSSMPPGVSFWVQYWVTDPGGPAGFSASNSLRGESQ